FEQQPKNDHVCGFQRLIKLLDNEIRRFVLKQKGVSLIELLTGLAVLGLVLAIAIPNLSSWMQDAQIRSAAESLLSGVQVARAEAIRRNYQATFYLHGSGGAADWCVDTSVQNASGNTDCNGHTGTSINKVQSWSGAQAKNARVGASTSATQDYSAPLTAGAGLPTSVTFDAMGHVVGTGITRIDVINSSDSSARRLVIIVSPYGLVRLCDPALSLTSNPQGCA
ncbi:MAG TPA: GspH/FimT family pseudopilin, partial [Burkholderiales bacterium]|nr:GspH/FimT family pseudopilin [Burkholderiales bacterium]